MLMASSIHGHMQFWPPGLLSNMQDSAKPPAKPSFNPLQVQAHVDMTVIILYIHYFNVDLFWCIAK